MKTRFLLILVWPFVLLFELIVQIWFLVSLIFNIDRAIKIILGYDRLGNIAMGQGNETISSWTGRHNSWLEPIINWIFKVLTGEDNHCDKHLEVK